MDQETVSHELPATLSPETRVYHQYQNPDLYNLIGIVSRVGAEATLGVMVRVVDTSRSAIALTRFLKLPHMHR